MAAQAKAKRSRMAKKKRPVEEWGAGKPLALQVRGTPEWKAWIDELARFDRSTVADVVDRSLAAYARAINFPQQPPPR